MRPRRHRHWIVAAGALVVASCGAEDLPTASEEEALGQYPIWGEGACQLRYKEVQPPRGGFEGRGIETAFVSAEAQIPGFAGYYIEQGRNLVVHVKSPVPENAREMFESLFLASARRFLSNLPAGSEPEIRVVAVDYAMSELITWFQMIHRNAGIGCGIHSMDADEYANRVRLGVRSAPEAEDVRGLLDVLEIPQEAVIFAIGQGATSAVAER